MTVGICRMSLRLPGSRSLKDKRQVVRSVVERVRHRFNVSMAEVDDLERWQVASLGFCCVSNDRAHVEAMLAKVVAFIEGERPDAEVVACETEFVRPF